MRILDRIANDLAKLGITNSHCVLCRIRNANGKRLSRP
jgi:hypothetical protein